MFNRGTWEKQKSVNDHEPVKNKTSSGGSRPLPSSSTEETIGSFVVTLNFIDSWLKSLNMNNERNFL